MDSQQCLWFSRLSFGVSLVALITAFTGGCQNSSPDVSPDRSQVSAPSNAEPPPGAEQHAGPAPGDDPSDERKREVAAPDDVAPNDIAQSQPPAAKAVPKAAARSAGDAADGTSGADEEGKAPDETAATEPLLLKRLVVTQAVNDREPAATEAIKIGDEPVIAFVELKNPNVDTQHIVVTFEPKDGGDTVGFIELEVPAQATRWRTWGNTRRVSRPGEWVAVVSTKAGQELGRAEFRVSDAS